ncbi:MAG: hypothetical protein IPL01_22715 [Acidobacteria bacterium]|nr:hypothetical protein [Acidobacteriota bacterium]
MLAAKRSRLNLRRLRRITNADFPLVCWSVFVYLFRPGDGDVGFGREQFTRPAIKNLKESVFRRLHQNLALLSLDFEIGKDYVLCRGEIPLITG